jgi:Zn-dependent metalloprotease
MRKMLLTALFVLPACGAELSEVGYEVEEGQAMSVAAFSFLRGPGGAALGLGGFDQVRQREVLDDGDELGAQHVRFDRSYRGLPVLGGDFIVNLQARGKEVSATLNAPLALTVTPEMTPDEARSLGVAARPGRTVGERPTLMVYAHPETLTGENRQGPRLAYEVIARSEAEDQPSVEHLYIDARSGELLAAVDEIQTAAAAGTGKGLYTGTVSLSVNTLTGGKSELRDMAHGASTTVDAGRNNAVFSATGTAYGNGASSDRASAAVDAHYGAATTWDYFKTVHGRNGIANNGKGATSRVHYGQKFNNAYWSDSCFCMTYGDGDGKLFRPLVALDVAGHEMTHGITSKTARLVYSGESGGLNEATSDIFGTAVEFFANNSAQPGNFLIGEKIGVSLQFLRSMSDPKADGRSIDHYSLYRAGIDVHLSSGIANNFFYLLSQGGKNRTSGLSVTGIGRAKAERIWYRALTTIFTSSTNFRGARAGCLRAARELYGANGAEEKAVAAAWSAVGVN